MNKRAAAVGWQMALPFCYIALKQRMICLS